MSVHIDNRGAANLGLLFARQSVPAAYDRQKVSPEADAAAPARTDTAYNVSLSPFVPRPLSAVEFEQSVETGKRLASGGTLETDRMQTLRQDRVFAAVSALAMLGEDRSKVTDWPGGIPAPTSEELEEARRRLSQRLQHIESATDADAARRDRLEILRAAGSASMTDLADALERAATAKSSATRG